MQDQIDQEAHTQHVTKAAPQSGVTHEPNVDESQQAIAAEAHETVAAAVGGNMLIGRLHAKDGFVAERTHDSTHPIRIGLSHGGDPFSQHTPVVWCEFTEQQFASLVAHVARRGETGETYQEALAFLQATGIAQESR